jgi:hypothetical protein
VREQHCKGIVLGRSFAQKRQENPHTATAHVARGRPAVGKTGLGLVLGSLPSAFILLLSSTMLINIIKRQKGGLEARLNR